MNEDECVMAKINTLIRKNNNIIRIDYALAKVYSKCLIDLENFKTATDLRKKERDDLETKVGTALNSIEILSKMIEEADTDIKRVKREIDHHSEKGEALQKHILSTVSSPTDEDQSKVFRSHFAMTILDMFKHCEEIKSMELGFDSFHRTQDESFHDDPWSQFQME